MKVEIRIEMEGPDAELIMAAVEALRDSLDHTANTIPITTTISMETTITTSNVPI